VLLASRLSVCLSLPHSAVQPSSNSKLAFSRFLSSIRRHLGGDNVSTMATNGNLSTLEKVETRTKSAVSFFWLSSYFVNTGLQTEVNIQFCFIICFNISPFVDKSIKMG